jgi:Zn finger protein HypA/HybF involved in hydrogenase expression
MFRSKTPYEENSLKDFFEYVNDCEKKGKISPNIEEIEKEIKDQQRYEEAMAESKDLSPNRDQNCYLNLSFNQTESYFKNPNYFKFLKKGNIETLEEKPFHLVSIQDNSIPFIESYSNSFELSSDESLTNEFVMCRSHFHKEFIKVVSYENILRHSLVILQNFESKQRVYSIQRESHGKDIGDEGEFKYVLGVLLHPEEFEKDDEFDILKQKQSNFKNFQYLKEFYVNQQKHAELIYQQKYKGTCPNCNKTFRSFPDFVYDFRKCIVKKYKKDSLEFYCPLCQKRYMNIWSLDQHLVLKHFGIE